VRYDTNRWPSVWAVRRPAGKARRDISRKKKASAQPSPRHVHTLTADVPSHMAFWLKLGRWKQKKKDGLCSSGKLSRDEAGV
jgi:hypothetical protein